MSGFPLRLASPEDAAAIKRMLDPILATGRYSAMQGPIRVDELSAHIDEACRTGTANLAEAGETVIGFQEVLPDGRDASAGQIGTFIGLQHHGRGLGRALLETSERQVRARGFDRLVATIRADNAGAQAFYAACGFVDMGRLSGYIVRGGQPIDAIVKEKRL